MPQLPSNFLAGLGAAPATGQGGARTPRLQPGGADRAGGAIAGRFQPPGAASDTAGRARSTDFLATLAQLRARLAQPPAPAVTDVPVPAAGNGTPPAIPTLPVAGKTLPPSLPPALEIEGDASTDVQPDAAAMAELVASTGSSAVAPLPPVIVDDVASTDSALVANVQGDAAKAQLAALADGAAELASALPDGEVVADDDPSAPRTLLALLDRHASARLQGTTEEPLPAMAALRAAATTAQSATAAAAADAAAVLAANAPAREAGFSFAASMDDAAAAQPALAPAAANASAPMGAAAMAISVPNDPARADVPVLNIEHPVGQNAWRDAVGQQVTWMIDNQVSRAELRLHPAHLGPIDVSVRIDNDKVHVTFQASHPATRDALEGSLPRLRELLGDSGLSLGNASVSQQFAGGQRAPERGASPVGDGVPSFDAGIAAHDEVATPVRVKVGLLDAYA